MKNSLSEILRPFRMKSVIGKWPKGATCGLNAHRFINEGAAKCAILAQSILSLAFPSHELQGAADKQGKYLTNDGRRCVNLGLWTGLNMLSTRLLPPDHKSSASPSTN